MMVMAMIRTRMMMMRMMVMTMMMMITKMTRTVDGRVRTAAVLTNYSVFYAFELIALYSSLFSSILVRRYGARYFLVLLQCLARSLLAKPTKAPASCGAGSADKA